MVGSNDPCSQTLNLAVSKIKADAWKSSQVRNVCNEEMKRKTKQNQEPKTKTKQQTITTNPTHKTFAFTSLYVFFKYL